MLEINSYEKQLNGLIIERDELIDQINELKNKIEQQEILIEKLKCCGNCEHKGRAEWCNLREEFVSKGYGEKGCVWKIKGD